MLCDICKHKDTCRLRPLLELLIKAADYYLGIKINVEDCRGFKSAGRELYRKGL